MDDYGRQTPVLTSDSGVFKVSQDNAPFMTQFTAKITSNAPSFAKSYKYFIKEISSTTHNFIGDSFYEDKEGFIYIAVPSADVNKVDVDDTIVLKKKRGNVVSDINEEFKVLDKYTTAPPPFLARPLKETYVPDVFVFSKNFERDRDQHILKAGSTPVPGRNRVTISAMYQVQETNIDSGGKIGDDTKDGVSREAYSKLNPGAKVKFITGDSETEIYTVANKELDLKDDNDFELHFTEEFGDDVKVLYEDYETSATPVLIGGDASEDNSTDSYGGGIKMVVVEHVDESGKEEYQGKFFIKIKSSSTLLTELKGEEDINNLQVISTISLDGNQADNNDPRQFHIYGGGKAGTNSNATKTGGSNPLNPQNGGFVHTTNHDGTVQSFGPGIKYTNSAITTGTGTIFVPAGELDQGYHFAIRSDRPFAHKDSNYGSLPFVTSLLKAPTNKNNFNTDNPVYMKFDRSLGQIAANQPIDNNIYKVTRIFTYRERRPNDSGGQFNDGDIVFLIKLDKDLAQNLIFNGALDSVTNDNGSEINVMQMSVLTFRQKDSLIGIPEPPIFEVLPKDDTDIDIYYETQENFIISGDGTNNHGNDNVLSYYNCFAFENGIESLTIRDSFNKPALGKGVRVSTIFEDKPFIEETKKNSLIFSQIYNDKNALNRLNQFIIAEDITKDINPDYGSIQLLHTRYNDIIAYCENRVVKILTNKDALFNADGNTNITSNKAVLGQAVPYNSNFGISNNPESFAAFTHRSYFTDRRRGVVVRHSMDGMEEISGYGMKDYFRDKCGVITTSIRGSYDVRKHQYNVTIGGETISFSESINGWVSKKSFIQEAGISMENKYFTFKNGHAYEHHVGNYSTFYGTATTPYVQFLLNEFPANIKNFRTLNYEGDLNWRCASIVTDMQDGDVSSFVKKENKYYNYIKGIGETQSTIDLEALNVQGIGDWDSNTSAGTNLRKYVFVNAVPEDLQIGDDLYYVHPSTGASTRIGPVTAITSTEVTANFSTTSTPPSYPTYFIFYVKNAKWQTSGLLGYHALVKFQLPTNTNELRELYSVGSEVSISS